MTAAMPWARRWLPRLIAVGLLVYAIWRAGPANIWQTLLTADWTLVGISAIMVLPFVVVRAARWRTLLTDLKIDLALSDAIRYYAIGLFIGTVTPGQAGDAIKAWYLASRGKSLAISLLSCVLDRLFDVLVLTAIATTALVVFWPAQQGQWLIGLAIIVGLVIGLVMLARPEIRRQVTNWPGLRLVWRPIERWLGGSAWGAALLESRIGGPTLLVSLALTGLGFVVTLSRVYLVFRAVGVDLALLPFLAVASVTVFAGLISVAGLGSRDVALITLLMPFGYGEQQAVAISFLILFLNFTNVGPGLAAWLSRPVPLKPALSGEQ